MPVPWAGLASQAGAARGRSQAWDREGDAARYAGQALARESGILADLRRRAEEQEAQQRAAREAADTARRFDLEDWLRNQRARKEEGLQRRAWEVEDRDLADARRPGPTPPRSLEDRLVEHAAKKQIDIAYEKPEKLMRPGAALADERASETLHRRDEADALARIQERVPGLGRGGNLNLPATAERLDAYATKGDEAAAKRSERRADARQAASDAKAEAREARRGEESGRRGQARFAEAQAKVAQERAPRPQPERASLVAREEAAAFSALMSAETAKKRYGKPSKERVAQIQQEAARIAQGRYPETQAPTPVVTPGMQALLASPGDIQILVAGIRAGDPDAEAMLAEIGATPEDLARVLAGQ